MQEGQAWMKRITLTAMSLTLLATACDSGEIEMKNASIGEVAEEMREARTASFVNPGKWQQTATLVSIEAPGMPPEAREMMSRAMGDAQVHEVCLTPEQAKSPREDFFTGADKNCRYEHFKWGDGKIDLKLNCDHPNASQTMILVGEYEPNSYTMSMTAANEGRAPGQQMVMKMKVDAKRVGECDGKASETADTGGETTGGSQ
jgi:hypothetical protein